MNKPAISVKGVSKSFRLPHEKSSGLKQAIIHFKSSKEFDMQQVLKDISFEVKEGEFFGIVGRNGSGKSTLLKLLAQIYVPNKGSIEINGLLTPFIELGVGFNPELTGRENIYLNGALLGLDRREVGEIYDAIVEFAELERFMDQKLKNYSSGMQVRLAFSIAIRAKSAILLIDEVLAVGDAAFQRKCYDHFMNLKKEKRTVVLVTHDMGAVRQYCDRAIMLEDGKVVREGTPEEIAQSYQKLFIEDYQEAEGEVVPEETPDQDRWGTGKMRTSSFEVRVSKEFVTIKTVYTAREDIASPILGFNIYGPGGDNLIEGNTRKLQTKVDDLKKGIE